MFMICVLICKQIFVEELMFVKSGTIVTIIVINSIYKYKCIFYIKGISPGIIIKSYFGSNLFLFKRFNYLSSSFRSREVNLHYCSC